MKVNVKMLTIRRFILHTSCVLLSISAAHAQNPEYVRHSVPSIAKAHASLAPAAKVFSPVSITNATRSWPKPLSSSTPWTAAGTEFYACFPSVVGSSDGDPATKIRSLFISSRAPARVTVEMLKGSLDTTFIVTPGQFARVDIPIYDALNRDDYEVAESKVIHIFSKEIITVYGLSHNYQSSDGFVIYPTQVLGTSYLVMSARNAVNYDLYGEIQTDTIKAPDTTLPNPRSEFAIVATQNNTNVTFTLTATSYSGRLLADSTYTIRLDRGQVYQVMARDTGTHLTSNPPNSTIDWWRLYAPWAGGPDCDLTGSYITSDKPIAVFSGHERAASPSAREYDPLPPNRDHLVEQMLPTTAWGKNFIIAGSGQDNAMGRPAGGDVVRILSGFNHTHVTVNGTPMFTLAQGEYRDVMSGMTAVIASDLPVLVAHIMQSSGTDNVGDPDLTLARPVEDYANEYTLPPLNDFPAFTEPHLLVICDTSVTKTTLYNGVPFPPGYWIPIPGTSFASGIFPVHYNLAQRIESPLPCYAEFFAYGPADSYTYAGGGDYPYVDSLFAADVNFQSVLVGKTKNQTSPVYTSTTAQDSVVIYNYEWVSGDTSSFTLIGGMSQTARIAPRGAIPLPFQFHPTSRRAYSALLRVWSDAVNPVFIRLTGMGVTPLTPGIAVIPGTIDFGRVRLEQKHDASFIIENIGTTQITLTDLAYGNSLSDTDFTADTLESSLPTLILSPGGNPTIPDTVHFQPRKLGLQVDSIPIFWAYPGATTTQDTPVVMLMGIGVEPSVVSTGYNFGSLRVDSISDTIQIRITNRGSDTTAIDSVAIVDSAALSTRGGDFMINLDTLPPSGLRKSPITLGYEGGDTSVLFAVSFQPRSLGADSLIVRIHTVDGDVLYDTLRGRGVEPLVLINPAIIDFGTILVPPSNVPISPMDRFFTISNAGTMAGYLDSLSYDTSKHFLATFNKPDTFLHEPLDTGRSITGRARFNVTEEGDFTDTLFLSNDTRYGLYAAPYQYYQPIVILKAKVRTDSIGNDSISFGTITTCDPDTNVVLLTNPYPVEVHIDSIALFSDTAGFSIPNNFVHQISIPPNGSYSLKIIYSFPPDSLNGVQVLKMGLYQRQLDGEPPVVDTVTAALLRKQRVFTLHALLPQYASSANDVSDLKLPITVQGPRAGVTELDSWTLSLQFSNDLFEPTGIDTTGALAIPGDSTYTITTHWDQATRTFTIIVTGSAVSDSAKIANDLLLSILMRAYLTTDTVVTVTPTFTWASHPCAYNLQSFTLSIPYADECGDPTIRAFMLGEKPFFTLMGAWPNPADRAGGVSLGYKANQPCQVTSEVFSESGEEIGRAITNVQAGAGTLAVNANMLPHSGAAFIRIEAAPIGGGPVVVKMVKVEVTK